MCVAAASSRGHAHAAARGTKRREAAARGTGREQQQHAAHGARRAADVRDQWTAAARDEEGSTRRKKMKKIRVEDPMDEIVCTNLKHLKMEKKKIFRKIYRIAERELRGWGEELG